MNKSRTRVLHSMAVLMPALLMFTIVTDLPHVLILTLFGYGISLLQRKPFKVSDRSIIYTGVVIAVAVGLLDLLFPFNRERFGYITMIFRPEYYTVGMFYLAVAMTFFDSGKATVGLAAAASIFSMTSSGDVFNFSIDNVRLPMFSNLINRNFTFLYVSSVILSLSVTLWALRREQVCVKAKAKGSPQRLKHIIHGAVIIALPLMLFGTYKLYRLYEDDLRRLENHLIQMGVRQRMMRRQGWTVFGKEVNLRNIMSPEVLSNQQRIVIRASGKHPPGYLRGHGYEIYQNGIWRENNTAAADELQSRSYSGMLTAKSFYFGEPATEYKYQYHILQEPDFISDVLLIPGSTQRLDLIAERVSVNSGGSAIVSDWQKDGGYTVFADATQTVAYPFPVNPAENDFLQFPDELEPDFDKVIDEIPGLREAKTDAARFQLILKFFNIAFSYDLNWQGVAGADPVAFFLCEVRRGHCELYASAMTLLLRRLKIPARYVTGFICAEPHPLGKYFVARLGNAHAWLEAYDRQQKKWLHLEPTPASEIDVVRGDWNAFSSGNDAFKRWRQQLLADLRRGLFAKVITDVTLSLLRFIWQNIVIFTIVIAGTLWWLRSKRKKIPQRRLNISAAKLKLGRSYNRQVKAWEKRAGISASASRTSTETLILLKNSGVFFKTEIKAIEQFIKRWQRLRFGTRNISQEELKSLETELHKCRDKRRQQ
ncbi:MAG: transglutaminase-like domain-containing protein [Victivallaceae bacterium]|nr:transglutaminase-like domain-containing protein [Victivallaceae bacterium]